MDIRVLRYFVSIVDEGNISNAAQKLHVSQPTLSRQIKELEEALGVTLFERGHRRIKLTQEGAYLFERAREVITLVDRTTYHLQARDMVSGTLEIGAGESDALAPVMDALASIMREYPEVRVNLVSGDAKLIRWKLDRGILDFGVVMGRENLTNYESLALPAQNHWGVLMSQHDPLTAKKVVQPADLVKRPLLTSIQSRHQDTFRNWAGDLINQYHFAGNYNLLYNAGLLVKTGACLALTYAGLVTTNAESGLAFRPLSPTMMDENNLIWAQDRPLPNVAQLFLKRLRHRLANN